MSDINSLLNDMQQRFNPNAAAGLDAIFQYDIIDNGSWQIEVKDNSCKINEGSLSDPNVTLAMNLDTLASVLSGETDGMQAFMSGNIEATGDVMLATRLADLFPINGG
jgi:putative sterol carrier protein